MAKEVQMSIRSAIRDLMRLYIAGSETPNALTAGTLRKSAEGEDVFHAYSVADLFKQLDI